MDARIYAYRHGALRPGGNADTFKFNCAFFDGHVTLQSTEPYSRAHMSKTAINEKAMSVNKGETIFWLHDQY